VAEVVMKTVIIGIVLVVGLGAAGYFAVPFLIEQKTVGLRAEVKDLRQRLENAEGFIYVRATFGCSMLKNNKLV